MLRILSSGLLFLTLAAWLILEPKPIEADNPHFPLRTQTRRPVALVVQGDHLLVGNRQSGSITVIDRATGTILAEHEIAQSIADMLPLPDSSSLLVLDDKQKELLKVAWQDGTPTVQSLAELPWAGSKMVFDEKTQRVFLTAKWAQRVMRLQMDETGERLVETQTIHLPFAPLELLLLPEGNTLLVADAFGNRLALLNAETGTLVKVHAIEGHNIRGLALNPEGQSVLIAHQHIPDGALADYEEVHWGRMVHHAVQVLEIAKLLQPHPQKPANGWLETFGGIGSASADPSGVLTGPNGLVAVAFSGVGEVAIRYQGTQKRIPVQSYPEAMTVAGDRLYVANRLEDSLSVIDLKEGRVTQTISLGPTPVLTSEERGEKLFHSAKLSHDGWLSCHSCHTDGHTAGLIVDTLGDGDYGAPKLVPTLLGTRDTQPWGWDGSMGLLREQLQQSITTTMHGEPLSVREMEDLFAYVTSLDPPPPPNPAPPELLAQGQAVFRERGCVNCHAPPAYTTPDTVDVSLMDELKRSRFNPPSLRGVSQRRRYFHDGRANSLEAVLHKVRHQLEEPLNRKDTEALLAFLRSL